MVNNDTQGREAEEALDMSSSDDANDESEPSLDAAMLNELLLVCSNLGMLRVSTNGQAPVFMRGEDCEQWIHDLQRALRRDHAKYRLVTKQLGQWKILQKKLLPLLVNHQHDTSLVLSILKVLVMLTTKPPPDSTNVAQQLKYLRAYKHEFLRSQVVSILMTILVAPLARKGAARTEQDYLYMEIVLMLVRNLLAIPNEDVRFVTSTTSHYSHLQEDLIAMLHEESVYELLLLFAQDIEAPENREWNLLVMEMLDLTLECSHPQAVVAFVKTQLIKPQAVTSSHSAAATRSTRGDLLATLEKEKKAAALQHPGSRRHSNFGGVLTMVGPSGRTSVVSDFSKTVYDQVPQAAKKPTSRRRGKKSAAPITDIHEIFGGKGKVTESDERTMRVLQAICDSILAKSYFQLTNSLKTEFRRGSAKLIATDRLQYFHLVWFLTTYHRLKVQMLKSHYKQQMKVMANESKERQIPLKKPDYEEKAVLSTLDMFSFNFVLQSIENYATMKKYHGMTVAVQLLTEMMAYLAQLTASDDPRFQRIADSLQHKILYERDFLDRLPVLLKTWAPGLFPKAYVIDVVTLTHLVFKVLDAQGTIKVLSRRKAYLDKKRLKKKEESHDSAGSSTDEEETEKQAQVMMEMQRKEADFDVRKYFSSLVTADTIRMYCFLLSTYRDNSVKVNHYIHSFLYRTKHFKLFHQDEWTLQPMLFNMHLLLVFNTMLQDAFIQHLPEFKSFLDFIRGVVRDFFTLADTNKLLFVETLLRQVYPLRSCMLLQRCYDPIEAPKSRAGTIALDREKQLAAISESRRHRIALDHEELEGEAEFQFALQPGDFEATLLVDKEDESEAMDRSEAASAVQSTPMSRAATERAKNWSKVEDRYLAKVFIKYRHLPSVYEVISYEDMFQERDRTPEQIERRVKYLKLHRKTHDSSDDDEEKEQQRDDEQQDGEHGEDTRTVRASRLEKDLAALDTVRPRRRLRRGSGSSDEQSDDDLLLGGVASTMGGSTANVAVIGVSLAASEASRDVEETQVLEESVDSHSSHQLEQLANDQSSQEETESTGEGRPNVVAVVTTADDGADAKGFETITAEMQDATITDRQASASSTGDATDTQLLKRSRTADDNVPMENTPAKKIHREES